MKMMTGTLSIRTGVMLSVVTALTLALPPVAWSQVAATTVVTETASIIGACGKLFDIDSNAACMTARQRAAIIQKNLDYAFIHARNRAPGAVKILVVNRNPVVTLDGFHIATADANSAIRNRLSQLELAQKWADSIRFCLADAAAMDKYLAMLTGAYAIQAAAPRSETIAYIPGGSFMPVKLVTPLCSESAQIGDRVAAIFTNDVPLRTSFSGSQYEAYLPSGTYAHGQIVDASNSYTRRAVSIRFDELRLPDGEVIPINGHIFGGIGTWVAFNPQPMVAEYGAMGLNPVPMAHRIPVRGTVCGGWRGYPQGAGIDIPYKKLTLTRRSNVTIPTGEPMMLQFGASTAIALCTNCGGNVGEQSVAQGGSSTGGANTATNPLAGGSGAL